MRSMRYVLPASRVWLHPDVRKRVARDALTHGLIFPPAPQTVPGALQRLLAGEDVFDGLDADALCRKQEARFLYDAKLSRLLICINLQKFPHLTWEAVQNMIFQTNLFEEHPIPLTCHCPTIPPDIEPTYLIDDDGIWADRGVTKIATAATDLADILQRKETGATGEHNELCISLKFSGSYSRSTIPFSRFIPSDASGYLLRGDCLRANLPPLDKEILTDMSRGHWDAYWPAGSHPDPQWYMLVDMKQPVQAANPWKSVRRGSQVAIDFGTSSTVAAVREEDGRLRLMRIGGEFQEAAAPAQYENPTALEFSNYQGLLDAWQHEPWRPQIRWTDIKCSHQACHELAAAERVSCGMRSIKTWAREQPGRPPLRLCDEKKHAFELSPLPLAENEGMTDVGDVSRRPVDPIELYAYFLGIFLNNQIVHGGVIYPRYYMTFPVKFDRRTRDRILQGFRRGLLRSLPPSLVYGQEWQQEAPFRIEEVASEPAAFAAAVLPRLDIAPTEAGEAFGVFDFGGGTTDFAFGLYRLATPEENENEGWENVLDILDIAGDEQLGGEHLLDMAAYCVIRDNAATLLKADIPFICPYGLPPFAGSELLLTESSTAQANMVVLREGLRPLWEVERFENGATGTCVLNLSSRGGQSVPLSLTVNENALRACLKERIREGVRAFFSTFRQAFRTYELQPERLHVLLAGNSCRSPLVQEVFEETVREILSEEQRDRIVVHYELLPGTKKNEDATDDLTTDAHARDGEDTRETREGSPDTFDDDLKLTLKTGVAIGLLHVLPGEATGLVERNLSDAESPFLFTVGLFRADTLQPVLERNAPYGQWTRLPQKVVRSGVTKLGYSPSPLALEQEIRRTQCREVNIEWGPEQFGRAICLRADDPHHVSMALETRDSPTTDVVHVDEATLRVIELRI